MNLAVVSIVVPLGVPPLSANFVGFLFSFAWRFFGLLSVAVPAQGRDVGAALWRFAVISLLSFVLTEAAYAGVLEWTSIDYRLSLYLVIVTLAFGKLVASKYWVFAR